MSFVLGLISENGNFNLRIDFSQLSSDQKKQYLGLVQNFAKYWKEYNKQYEEGNVYDDTPTHEGPDAALDVFNKSNK